MATKGSANRRRQAVHRSARNAALQVEPTEQMLRHGATVLAIALTSPADQNPLHIAREVWAAMAAQRAKEMEAQ